MWRYNWLQHATQFDFIPRFVIYPQNLWQSVRYHIGHEQHFYGWSYIDSTFIYFPSIWTPLYFLECVIADSFIFTGNIDIGSNMTAKETTLLPEYDEFQQLCDMLDNEFGISNDGNLKYETHTQEIQSQLISNHVAWNNESFYSNVSDGTALYFDQNYFATFCCCCLIH